MLRFASLRFALVLVTASVVSVLLSGSPAQAQVIPKAIITSTKITPVTLPGKAPIAPTYFLQTNLSTINFPAGITGIDGVYTYYEVKAGLPDAPILLGGHFYAGVPNVGGVFTYVTTQAEIPKPPAAGTTYKVVVTYRWGINLVFQPDRPKLSSVPLLVKP